MRTFLFLCLVAIVAAQYDYSPQLGNAGSGFGVYAGAVNAGIGLEDYSAPVASNVLNKEYFTFSAPESEFDDSHAAEKIAGSLKKKLRVIFIKGPEISALEDAVHQLAQSAANERTAIYVLNKQADIGDLANKLNDVNNHNNNKPEVHFVKYRTPADAENAQRAIQSQYDSLPGTSAISDGGIAPVLSFTSKAPVHLAGLTSNGDLAGPRNSHIPSKSPYLPPRRRV